MPPPTCETDGSWNRVSLQLYKDWYCYWAIGGIFAKCWSSIGRLASDSPRVAVGKYEKSGKILSRVVVRLQRPHTLP
eukprot:3207754-Prymnesium_polylepis.1